MPSPVDRLLEISATGISKASGLASLAEGWAVGAADVVALGDMPNHLPMLRHSVAMADAPGGARGVGEVTGTNDEDGVAQVLECWF